MFDSSLRAFVAEWARNPVEVGAIVPSGDPLAEAMARQVHGIGDGLVLELGGGTGTVTRALLRTGIPEGRLVVVERNSRLIEHLRRRFPAVRIVRGDAVRLAEIARVEGLERAAAVVSGLPLRLISDRKRYAILRHAFGLLQDDAPFVQFSYGPLCPMPRMHLRRLAIMGRKIGIVWLNFPPAAIWRFERARIVSSLVHGVSAAGSIPVHGSQQGGVRHKEAVRCSAG